MLSENQTQALAEIEHHLLEEHPVLAILARRLEAPHRRDARPCPAARALVVAGLLLMVVCAVLMLPAAAMAGALLSLCGLGLHVCRGRDRRRPARHLGGHHVGATRNGLAPAPHGPARGNRERPAGTG